MKNLYVAISLLSLLIALISVGINVAMFIRFLDSPGTGEFSLVVFLISVIAITLSILNWFRVRSILKEGEKNP